MTKNRLAVWILPVVFSILASFAFPQEEFVNSLYMKMVPIPSGSFDMGQEREDSGLPLSLIYGDKDFMGGDVDEQPVHRVVISRSFHMAATEVSNAQYEQFDPDHRKYRGQRGLSTGDDEAVVFVSWHDAVRFCRWLSRREGRPYRLPTEAEWEYAARAGTRTRFHTGQTLPDAYLREQQQRTEPEPVSTVVGRTPPNAWGLHDMHGNVEEWIHDWYGPYTAGRQEDPLGRESGIWKVVRGGSHNVDTRALRSANRQSTLAEDRHWLLGFRVVQAPMPAGRTLPAQARPQNGSNVRQSRFDWEANKKEGPYFEGPVKFVLKPDDPAAETFFFHNHLPSITWCDNGDLLAAWYSGARERGRELSVVASRHRAGTGEWDKASAFFNARDRNMHGTALFNTGTGTLLHLNGLGTDGTWKKLAQVVRSSTDNGATWSHPRIVDAEHGDYIIHMGISRLQDGSLIAPSDAPGGSGLYSSSDDGRSWRLITRNGKRRTILGSHAGVVQLKDGSLYALGRGEEIEGKMPVSRSYDGGLTWQYYASPFPPISGAQRPVLMRLREGALLFVGFSDRAKFQKVEVNRPRPRAMSRNGIVVRDASGKERTVYGMFAAVSFDEGETWPHLKLLSDFGTGRRLNGEAWTQNFIMDETQGEPLGYLAATQSPDNVIHLVSSGQHYRFNLDWIVEPMPPASGRVLTFFMGKRPLPDTASSSRPGLLGMEFIFEKAPFGKCHASTLVETEEGLVAAWFGGTDEGHPDVGIWLSRLTPEGWTAPVQVASGVGDSGESYPTWNPVLFQPSEGPLILFYKVGPNPDRWRGMMKTSSDRARSWSDAIALPEGFLGPIKNKPIQLQDGSILNPSSREDGESWTVHFEKYWPGTGRWEKIGPIHDGSEFSAIQPSLLTYFKDDPANDKMQMLARSRQDVLTQSWSRDRGRTWTPVTATSLPNPSSGTDALTLSNGMQLLVYNHTTRSSTPRARSFLNVAVSRDGQDWEAALILEHTEKSEFSYPAVIQTADDRVHITYTWNRKRIKHVVLDPDQLETRRIVDGKWPN